MSDSTSSSEDDDNSMDSLCDEVDDDELEEEEEELYCGCEDCYWHCLNSNIGNDDEEAFLFHFNPIADVELICNADIGTMSYFALFELAKMTCSILGAWKIRKSVYSFDTQHHMEEKYGLNLVRPYKKDMYNLFCSAKRDKLKSYSVQKLLHEFGGVENILKLEKEVIEITKFVKNCLLAIVSYSLPCVLPPHIVRKILSHLLTSQDLHKIGLVYEKEDQLMLEAECMLELYRSLANVYRHLQMIMFNVEFNISWLQTVNPFSIMDSLEDKKLCMSSRFEMLTELVDIVVTETEVGNIEAETGDSKNTTREDRREI